MSVTNSLTLGCRHLHKVKLFSSPFSVNIIGLDRRLFEMAGIRDLGSFASNHFALRA